MTTITDTERPTRINTPQAKPAPAPGRRSETHDASGHRRHRADHEDEHLRDDSWTR